MRKTKIVATLGPSSNDIGLFILIVACIFNIMNKLVKKVSLNTELEASATYVNQINQEENKNLNK